MKILLPKLLLSIVLIGMTLDLMYLHTRLSSQPISENTDVDDTTIINESVSNEEEVIASPQLILQPEFSKDLNEATKSLTRRVDLLEKNTVTSLPMSTVNKSKTEYYIPLGTGTVTATDWTDVGGAEAYIVPANLGVISEMYFEASAFAVSGQVFVRLKNVTDNNGLFESEISHDGSAPKLISSGKIPVPTTTRLYRVQMKSALGNQATLTNARIKLFLYPL